MAQSSVQFAHKMNTAADRARKAPWKAVESGALEAKRIAQHAGGRPVKGRKLGARYDMTGTPAAPAAIIKATPKAFWQWKSEGTRPHAITSRYAGGSRRSRGERVAVGGLLSALAGGGGSVKFRKGDRRAVLNIPGIGYRKYARHPGTRGDKRWTLAVRVMAKRCPEKIGRYWLDETVRKTFG